VRYLLFADFDAITDPIMKAKMVALKGINKVMVQNNMGMTPMVMNRYNGLFVFSFFSTGVSNSFSWSAHQHHGCLLKGPL